MRMSWELLDENNAVNHTLKVDVAWDKPELALAVSIGQGTFTLIPLEVIIHLLENNGYCVKDAV